MTVTITYATETNELESLILNDVTNIILCGEVIMFIDSIAGTYTYHYSNIIFSVR